MAYMNLMPPRNGHYFHCCRTESRKAIRETGAAIYFLNIAQSEKEIEAGRFRRERISESTA